mmetsp:Transcript_14724/g.33365  ORF Transcript_14724/g.33365 Transcript_14724/m.33365 type:complete len:329 (+) Transcript_14724:579-1565(+)
MPFGDMSRDQNVLRQERVDIGFHNVERFPKLDKVFVKLLFHITGCELGCQHGVVARFFIHHEGITRSYNGSCINGVGGSNEGLETNFDPIFVFWILRNCPFLCHSRVVWIGFSRQGIPFIIKFAFQVINGPSTQGCRINRIGIIRIVFGFGQFGQFSIVIHHLWVVSSIVQFGQDLVLELQLFGRFDNGPRTATRQVTQQAFVKGARFGIIIGKIGCTSRRVGGGGASRCRRQSCRRFSNRWLGDDDSLGRCHFWRDCFDCCRGLLLLLLFDGSLLLFGGASGDFFDLFRFLFGRQREPTLVRIRSQVEQARPGADCARNAPATIASG